MTVFVQGDVIARELLQGEIRYVHKRGRRKHQLEVSLLDKELILPDSTLLRCIVFQESEKKEGVIQPEKKRKSKGGKKRKVTEKKEKSNKLEKKIKKTESESLPSNPAS